MASSLENRAARRTDAPAKDPRGRIKHASKPDRDNCEKALFSDALKLIGFFVDDSQICAGEVRKFYAAIDERPGAEVTITWSAQLVATAPPEPALFPESDAQP